MIEGIASRNRDPRDNPHVKHVPPTEDLLKEVFIALISPIHHNKVCTNIFEPPSAIGLFDCLTKEPFCARQHALDSHILASDLAGDLLRAKSAMRNWNIGDGDTLRAESLAKVVHALRSVRLVAISKFDRLATRSSLDSVSQRCSSKHHVSGSSQPKPSMRRLKNANYFNQVLFQQKRFLRIALIDETLRTVDLNSITVSPRDLQSSVWNLMDEHICCVFRFTNYAFACHLVTSRRVREARRAGQVSLNSLSIAAWSNGGFRAAVIKLAKEVNSCIVSNGQGLLDSPTLFRAESSGDELITNTPSSKLRSSQQRSLLLGPPALHIVPRQAIHTGGMDRWPLFEHLSGHFDLNYESLPASGSDNGSVYLFNDEEVFYRMTSHFHYRFSDRSTVSFLVPSISVNCGNQSVQVRPPQRLSSIHCFAPRTPHGESASQFGPSPIRRDLSAFLATRFSTESANLDYSFPHSRQTACRAIRRTLTVPSRKCSRHQSSVVDYVSCPFKESVKKGAT